MSEYSEGICGDGVAILKDGTMMTPDEIVADLRRIQHLTEALEKIANDSTIRGIHLSIAARAVLRKANDNG